MSRIYWIAIILGLLIGSTLQKRVETQTGELLFGRDSVSGTAVSIQTNGSNALNVAAQ